MKADTNLAGHYHHRDRPRLLMLNCFQQNVPLQPLEWIGIGLNGRFSGFAFVGVHNWRDTFLSQGGWTMRVPKDKSWSINSTENKGPKAEINTGRALQFGIGRTFTSRMLELIPGRLSPFFAPKRSDLWGEVWNFSARRKSVYFCCFRLFDSCREIADSIISRNTKRAAGFPVFNQIAWITCGNKLCLFSESACGKNSDSEADSWKILRGHRRSSAVIQGEDSVHLQDVNGRTSSDWFRSQGLCPCILLWSTLCGVQRAHVCFSELGFSFVPTANPLLLLMVINDNWTLCCQHTNCSCFCLQMFIWN